MTLLYLLGFGILATLSVLCVLVARLSGDVRETRVKESYEAGRAAATAERPPDRTYTETVRAEVTREITSSDPLPDLSPMQPPGPLFAHIDRPAAVEAAPVYRPALDHRRG